VPLVVPEGVTQGEVKVRVWGEPGALPALAGDTAPWTRLNVEDVPHHSRLPALVLRAQRVNAALVLQVGEREPVFTVLVQRALVRVAVEDSGGQQYQASFLLSRLATPHLDVELPAPVPALNLRVTLDGKHVDPEVIDGTGEIADAGSVARLRLGPGLVRPGSVLEVSYLLPPGRPETLLRTTLHPPLLKGDPGAAPTRWQVVVPAGWVVVAPEGGPGSAWAWARRGWLWAPRLTDTAADLERWFGGSEAGRAEEREADVVPGLVCWHPAREPLPLMHTSQQAWLLACSLGSLVLGLGLYGLSRPAEGQALSSTWFWAALGVTVLGVAAAALLWPRTLATVAYGAEPGAAVLAVVAVVQWLLHERYRRHIVFLPSFSRSRTGSSLVRTPQRGHGEPSTVDVPHPTGSSAGRHEALPVREEPAVGP
jgi:hypothetical protein